MKRPAGSRARSEATTPPQGCGRQRLLLLLSVACIACQRGVDWQHGFQFAGKTWGSPRSCHRLCHHRRYHAGEAEADRAPRRGTDEAATSRRQILWRLAAAPSLGLPLVSRPSPALALDRPACGNIEDCRRLGDERYEELERQRGPIIDMGGGLRYRESRVGVGAEIAEGDVVYITYEVRRASTGDYMYSYGRGRPDMPKDDLGETYRVRLGSLDVPLGVEMALVGMRVGGQRAVELPRRLGFETSDFKPEPTNYSGKRRMERIKSLMARNSVGMLGDSRVIIDVEVVKKLAPTPKSGER
mmetsp:Transcript_69918/g.167830  ORF Transcript_69918/g.167830 Transcript_69918/m.167830 type:complete len:300 (-) Transcript_69918:182-1081(-)